MLGNFPIRSLFFAAVASLLGACASAPPLVTSDVDTTVAPRDVVTDANATRGKKVLWGGIIVNSRNREQHTQLELLAYPLDDRQRPRLDREPLGRFVADYDGYLETVDYAAGRALSLTGTVNGTKEGRIDDAVYAYPAITIDQLTLWPKPKPDDEPRIQFGIGVFMHN